MPEGDIEENTAVHLAACSVTVTTDELALMSATMTNGRINPLARTVARRETTLRGRCHRTWESIRVSRTRPRTPGSDR